MLLWCLYVLMTAKRSDFKRPWMVKWLSRAVLSLGRGIDLVDDPGGTEATGGVVADAHSDFVALAGLRVAQGEACAVSRGLDGTALAGNPVVLADDAERVGAVGEIGRQLVQKRAGAEDFGCEIDGEVLGDGGRCRCGGWGRCGYRSPCRCGNSVASSGGHGFDDGCGLQRRFRLDRGICGLHGDGRVCSCSFNLNLRRVLVLDFASMGVDAMVVMPAFAFSGS